MTDKMPVQPSWRVVDGQATLFKSTSMTDALAWVEQNKEKLPRGVEIIGHYCPYIPLTIGCQRLTEDELKIWRSQLDSNQR